MLTTSAAKFCVEPRSPFSNISHHGPKSLGKPVIIVSWPECRPEPPSDGDGGGVQRTLSIWRDPSPPRTGSKYPVRGIPHFDEKKFECFFSLGGLSSPRSPHFYWLPLKILGSVASLRAHKYLLLILWLDSFQCEELRFLTLGLLFLLTGHHHSTISHITRP